MKKYFLNRNKKKQISKKQQLKYSIVNLPAINNYKGTALVSYLNDYTIYNELDPYFNSHSTKWMSHKIINIFSLLGYDVDAINWDNDKFFPEKKYDVIFDLHQNLSRIAPFLSNDCIKILHQTGSYPEYAANRELDRVDQLIKRKNIYYHPKRITNTIYGCRSVQTADAIALLGSEHTKSTYPEQFREKITLLPVTYSKTVQKNIKKPLGNEFLWFYGFGAVHKGLDLILDVFSENQNYKLNIVGDLESEKDFMSIYQHELNDFPNIKYHGFLSPLSNEFKQIIEKCFSFIACSCSEGISTAAITCLIAGLYPIYSIDNGLTLPENTGYLLKNCHHDSILKSIKSVSNYKEEDLKGEIQQIQDFIVQRHSRDNFAKLMKEFIELTIQNKSKKCK